MPPRQPRYSKQEYAQRGGEIYQQQIQPLLEAGNKGKIVAIDIETAEYAVGENILSASQSLIDRNADAQIWVVRVGHRAVHQIRAASRDYDEREDWFALSRQVMQAAYGDDEPEYTLDMLREVNLDYAGIS